MAYILGFIFADGSIDTNPRGSIYLSIQITDKDLLETIRTVLGSDHKIATRFRRKETESTQYRLQIGGEEFCNNLMGHGITRSKAKTMMFPKIPKKYLEDFIRGYFDGDGNVWIGYMHKNRKTPTKTILVAFTSCSYVFLSSLLLKLRERGLTGGSLIPIKNKECFRLTFSTKDSLKIHKIMYNGTTSLLLQRKKYIFETFMRP